MKRIAVALILIVVAALLVALMQIPSTNAAARSAAMRPRERGDQELYGRFFARVTVINQQADEAERLGMNSAYLRLYFTKNAQLTASQTVLLNETAAALAAQLADYDARAQQTKTDWHVLVQKNRQNQTPIPQVSSQLRGLRAGRDALILQARDRLRQGLGDAEFARLDAYVRGRAAQANEIPSDQNGARTTQATAAVPDRVLYRRVFHLIAYYKTRAAEERALGLTELSDGLLTIVQRHAGLNEAQGRTLEEVVTEYLKAEKAYSAQLEQARLPLKKLTLEMLAQTGAVNRTPEFVVALRPVTAIEMQIDAATDSAIERLRTELGADGFARLEEFMKRKANSPPGTVASAQTAFLPEVTR